MAKNDGTVAEVNYVSDDSAEKHREAIRAEYGRYVATRQIFHDGVLAYNPGDAVPVSNVQRHGYDKDGAVRLRESPAPAKGEQG